LPSDRLSGFVAIDPVLQAQLLAFEPASPPVWKYSNAAVSLIAPILARAVGGSVEDFAKAVLFSPLGIDDYDWRRDTIGNVRTDAGLGLRARDVAKLAWMMADGGRWQRRQVVPTQWVDESMRPRIAARVQAPPITAIAYGYLWFTGTMGGRAVIWAWGRGAQFALMVPSLKLVVVTLADNPSAKELGQQNAAVMGLVAQIVELAGSAGATAAISDANLSAGQRHP
jgi:CubicO group peptidase (beta-lactamase class C family)